MRLLVLLLAVLALGSGACQASGAVLVDHQEARDYRFTFRDGSWLKGPAVLHGYITLSSGEELWVHLEGSNGEMAALVASRWAGELDRKRRGVAKSQSNSFVVYGVQRIELLSRMRGLSYRETGVSR